MSRSSREGEKRDQKLRPLLHQPHRLNRSTQEGCVTGQKGEIEPGEELNQKKRLKFPANQSLSRANKSDKTENFSHISG